MVLPARWENFAHKKCKCGKSNQAHDAQEDECAIQTNLFFPGECVPPTAGIVYRPGFVVHAAMKPGQDTDADAERDCQNNPEAARGQCSFEGLHFSFQRLRFQLCSSTGQATRWLRD